jgi:H+/gluconate symporter-like permease
MTTKIEGVAIGIDLGTTNKKFFKTGIFLTCPLAILCFMLAKRFINNRKKNEENLKTSQLEKEEKLKTSQLETPKNFWAKIISCFCS